MLQGGHAALWPTHGTGRRRAIVAACRTHGILPVDGPVRRLFRRRRLPRAGPPQSATLGMVGKWAIHPRQIALANEVFTPSDAAVAEAREILAAMAAAKARGAGATVYKGRLVTSPRSSRQR